VKSVKNPSQYSRIWKLLPHPTPDSVVRLFARDSDVRHGDFAESPRDIRGFADAHAPKGMNIYLAPNPTEWKGGTRHSAKHVSHWSYLLLDADPVEKEYDAARALHEALDLLSGWVGKDLASAARLPLILDSGRGMQAWIRLEDIVLDDTVEPKAGIVDGRIHRKTAARVNSHWLKKLSDRMKVAHGCQIDTSVSDLPRVMRCPGTVNTKTGRKARIVNETNRVYEGLAYLLSALPEQYLVEPEPQFIFEPGQKWQAVFHHLTRTAQEYLTRGWVEPGRHKTANHVAKSLKEKGCARKEVWKALKRANMLRGADEALPLDQLRHCLNTAFGGD